MWGVLFVVLCLAVIVYFEVFWCGACNLLFVAHWFVCVACCLLVAACCVVLFVVRCVMFVVCRFFLSFA